MLNIMAIAYWWQPVMLSSLDNLELIAENSHFQLYIDPATTEIALVTYGKMLSGILTLQDHQTSMLFPLSIPLVTTRMRLIPIMPVWSWANTR